MFWKATYDTLPSLSTRLKWMLFVIIALALLGDFICNEKPIYYKEKGQHHFPIFSTYMSQLGLKESVPAYKVEDWRRKKYDKAIRALVPYSYHSIDVINAYKGPFDKQQIRSLRWRHWLGTDQLGRDVLAGWINGLRKALLIGLLTLVLITLIGVPLGILIGYYGNEGLEVDRTALVLAIVGSMIGLFYAVMTPLLEEVGNGFWNIIAKGFFVIGALLLSYKIGTLFPYFKNKINIPVDFVGLKIIEILDAIPVLFFMLPLMAILETSIWNIILILGLLSWTGVARIVRAEMLKIRNLPYIEAARSVGLNNRQIIYNHALPNALTPVIVFLAFAFGSIIIVEALLTFLGFGLPAEEVTWGSMLNGARANIKAWWLAVIPSISIFVMVFLANFIGRTIEKRT